MDYLRGMEPVDKERPVLVPGDPERIAAKRVNDIGAIKYTPNHIVCYRKLAAELNVNPMQMLGSK